MNRNVYNPYYSNQNIWSGIKNSFHYGNNLTKLIYVNIATFLGVKILRIISMLLGLHLDEMLVTSLMLPAHPSHLFRQIWSVFTYMFLHTELMHILMNMLWLFWFGRIFSSHLGQKKLLSVYILGGLTGAAFYVFSYNLFPALQNARMATYALGASASVMAIVFAVVTHAPNHVVHLVFIGKIKMKYIALFFVVSDLLYLSESVNIGGHIAHLGGAFYGWLFVSQLRRGRDISYGFRAMAESGFQLFRKKKKMKASSKKTRDMTDYEYRESKQKGREDLNQILDKIAKSGYDSLNKEEKETLFKSSN